MSNTKTPPETPLPKRVTLLEAALHNRTKSKEHACKHENIEVLLDAIKRWLQWRTWAYTGGIGIAVTLVVIIFGWLYNTGAAVGAAEKDLEYIQETQARSQSERNELRREQLRAERQTAQQFTEIQRSLSNIENQVGRLEQRVEDSNGTRAGRRSR